MSGIVLGMKLALIDYPIIIRQGVSYNFINSIIVIMCRQKLYCVQTSPPFHKTPSPTPNPTPGLLESGLCIIVFVLLSVVA